MRKLVIFVSAIVMAISAAIAAEGPTAIKESAKWTWGVQNSSNLFSYEGSHQVLSFYVKSIEGITNDAGQRQAVAHLAADVIGGLILEGGASVWCVMAPEGARTLKPGTKREFDMAIRQVVEEKSYDRKAFGNERVQRTVIADCSVRGSAGQAAPQIVAQITAPAAQTGPVIPGCFIPRVGAKMFQSAEVVDEAVPMWEIQQNGSWVKLQTAKASAKHDAGDTIGWVGKADLKGSNGCK